MSDRLFGGVTAILSLAFLVFAVPTIGDEWRSGPGASYFTVGPRLFPYIAGGMTLVFGLMIALFPGRTEQDLFLTPTGRGRVLLAMAMTGVFVVLLEPLGFVIAGILALVAFFVAFGERRVLIILPVAIGVPVLVYTIFLKGFSLELPTGPIPLPI